MIEQKRIEEMRARLKGWNEGFTDNEILSEANGIILRVPGLLDALEEIREERLKYWEKLGRMGRENERLHALLEEWRAEYKRWTIANSAESMNPKLRPHLDQLKVENERLREAIRFFTNATLKTKKLMLEQGRKPPRFSAKMAYGFAQLKKVLEDARVQDDRWNWHKSCRVCGMMFRKIDGVWTGNHKGWCDFAKAKGGDSS
jgi:hypothetical protein